MNEEKEIIEVEAVEVNPSKEKPEIKIQKAKHQYCSKIEKIEKITYFLSRLYMPMIIIFGFGSITFGILYNENKDKTALLIMLIVCLVLLGLGVISIIIRLVLYFVEKRLKSLDPNFEDNDNE